MMTVNVSFDLTDAIIKKKGIENFGPVHRRLNTLLLNYCEPYIPKKSGYLISSGESNLGYISWSAPYAKKQYYENKGNGLRGRLWFDRMWASRKGEIISSLKSYVSDGGTRFEKAAATLARGEGPRRSDKVGGRRWL